VTTRLEFGDWLRRQRERRGITLKAIADQTKVSAGLFAALERGDCSRWPAGIYSRAWVRNYALVVGLDPQVTTERFSQCFAETAFPDPEPVAVEHPLRRALRKLTALFHRTPPIETPAVEATPAPAPVVHNREREVAIPQRLVPTNIRRQNTKRVVSRRKRRRVERAIRRNAIA
jgi:transcriptional regulator with XRE-family HTH domain